MQHKQSIVVIKDFKHKKVISVLEMGQDKHEFLAKSTTQKEQLVEMESPVDNNSKILKF